MIAVDTNILVYSHRSDSPFHQAAKKAMEELRAAGDSWAIPWPCVHEFIGVVTHPRIYKNPTSLPLAFASITSWQAGRNLLFLAESQDYLEKLHEISRPARLQGPRIHDARVAALCLHHGIRELWTQDRDFSAFPRMKCHNPLLGN